MEKVAHINKLSGKYITGFSGKETYADSMLLAQDFAKRNNVELLSYYEQEHGGKSILVGYNIKENDNEVRI